MRFQQMKDKRFISVKKRTNTIMGLAIIGLWRLHPAVQIYAATCGHDDNEIDNFYQQLKKIMD